MTTRTAERIPEWTIGDRLRKARALTGLNSTDFANEIGVSAKTINNYEGDTTKHHRRIVLNAWALATGVPVEWLETGVGSSVPDGPDHAPTASPEAARKVDELAAQKRRRRSTDEYLPFSRPAVLTPVAA